MVENLEKRFEAEATTESSSKWENAHSRMKELSTKPFDTRTEFERDNMLSTIFIAYRDIRGALNDPDNLITNMDLTLIGIIGIKVRKI